MKRLLGLSAMVVAAGVLAGCNPRKEDSPPSPKVAGATGTLPVLGAAPTWRLQDVNGKAVSSQDLEGKVVVVDFWATWCGPCRMEIPGYTELQKKYGDQGLVIVGMSVDQGGVELVREFGRSNKINYPLVMADEAVVAAFGGVQGIPTTFLIDRKGQIRDRKVGAMETAEYEKRIKAVL